ncbi:MAG: sulfatase [Gammaproteobacteria bacterium]|nr:sulfatase [Gammaproteobacteria bacterium]
MQSVARKPNVLWISFEDCLPLYGCYGDPIARTPAVDRLALEGCIYPNAFSTAPICAPARAAVITGMYPTSIGAHHMRTTRGKAYDAPVPHYAKCLGEYFRGEGYYCTNNVKTDYQFEPPFAAWDDCSNTAHWRNRPDPATPFFAVFNPEYTHESGMWEEQRTWPFNYIVPSLKETTDPDSVEVPPYFPDTPRVRSSIARNYDNMALCDQVMEALLGQLEEDGLADNTIVVHWSDHGPMPRGKRHPYDQGIHSPMIIRWPGVIEPGTTSDRLVSTVDLGPTMLSACGITVPPHMQGRAFLGAQDTPEREYIHASVDRSDADNDMVRAVRDKTYKYIKNGFPEKPYLLWNAFRNRHPIMQEWYRCWMEGTLNETQSIMFAEKRPVEELYDTRTDPWEVHNLVEDDRYREVLDRMREELDTWQEETRDLGLLDEKVMKSIHYPDGEKPVCTEARCLVFSADSYGEERAPDAFSLPRRHRLQLFSPTQGCSICFTLDQGDQRLHGSTPPATGEEPALPHASAVLEAPPAEGSWELYKAPISLPAGSHRLRTVVSRIGYHDSLETTFEITVTPE